MVLQIIITIIANVINFKSDLARVLDELGPKRPGEIDPYVASAVDLPLKIDNCHQLIAERVSDVFLQIWNRNVLIRNCDEMIIELVGVRARRWPSVGDLRRWSDQSDHLIWMLSHCQLLFSPSIFKYCQVLSYQVLSSSIVIKYCQVLSVMSSMAGKDHLIWLLSPFLCHVFTYRGPPLGDRERGEEDKSKKWESWKNKRKKKRAARDKKQRGEEGGRLGRKWF